MYFNFIQFVLVGAHVCLYILLCLVRTMREIGGIEKHLVLMNGTMCVSDDRIRHHLVRLIHLM